MPEPTPPDKGPDDDERWSGMWLKIEAVTAVLVILVWIAWVVW